MRKVEYIIGAFLPNELEIITHIIPDYFNNNVPNPEEKIINNNNISTHIQRKTGQTTKRKNIPANEL